MNCGPYSGAIGQASAAIDEMSAAIGQAPVAIDEPSAAIDQASAPIDEILRAIDGVLTPIVQILRAIDDMRRSLRGSEPPGGPSRLEEPMSCFGASLRELTPHQNDLRDAPQHVDA